jgi:hypothetical protein
MSVVIPLVNFNQQGVNAVTVYGFAELYINSAFNPKTDASIQACFISTVDPNAIAGNGPNNGVWAPPVLIQ